MKHCSILKSFRSGVYLISFCLVLASWKNSLLYVLSDSRGCTVQDPCQGQRALGGQAVPWELSDALWGGWLGMWPTTRIMAVRVRDRGGWWAASLLAPGGLPWLALGCSAPCCLLADFHWWKKCISLCLIYYSGSLLQPNLIRISKRHQRFLCLKHYHFIGCEYFTGWKLTRVQALSSYCVSRFW